MKYHGCSQEDAVVRAARSGQWEDSLKTHVDECRVCREVAQATQWMQRLAGRFEEGRPLPDPGLMWLRAQIMEDHAIKERGLRTLRLAGTVAQGGLALAAAVWATWNWSGIQSLLTRLDLQQWYPTGLLTVSVQNLILNSAGFFTASLMLPLVALLLPLAICFILAED
jgi:hypothetical protein